MQETGNVTLEIEICSSCVKKHVSVSIDDVVIEVKKCLKEIFPEKNVLIKTYSCFRLCPDKRITFDINKTLTFSKEATVKSLVQEVVSVEKYQRSKN
ncbi:MAG: hypothetical protein ACK41T_08320 [Pseudobdellovibrio sp.]